MSIIELIKVISSVKIRLTVSVFEPAIPLTWGEPSTTILLSYIIHYSIIDIPYVLIIKIIVEGFGRNINCEVL